jgi:ABC-type transport system substrate-binding protein
LGFEAGDLDHTWTAVSSIQRLRESPPEGGVVLEKPSLAYVWLGMNNVAAPLDNPNIRRAIQHAIDRQTVVDAAYFGAASTSTGIIAPGLPGHRDAVLYDYDPDRARELLAQEGVSDLFVTLDILNQSERLTAAQVIQANLADVGITCEIKQNDSGTFWTLGDDSSGDLLAGAATGAQPLLDGARPVLGDGLVHARTGRRLELGAVRQRRIRGAARAGARHPGRGRARPHLQADAGPDGRKRTVCLPHPRGDGRAAPRHASTRA